MQKEIDTESIVIINDEIMDENNVSKEMSYNKNSSEIIDHACDENGINLLNTEK